MKKKRHTQHVPNAFNTHIVFARVFGLKYILLNRQARHDTHNLNYIIYIPEPFDMHTSVS